jgi:molecular chaperone DnaJ
VRVNVKTPEHLTKEQKELLRKFAQLRGESVETIDKSILSKVRNLFN